MNGTAPLTLYGAEGYGSIAVEAALLLLGIPYSLVEGATWVEAAARERVASRNPLRQVPTLVLPGGEVMTESAAGPRRGARAGRRALGRSTDLSQRPAADRACRAIGRPVTLPAQRLSG